LPNPKGQDVVDRLGKRREVGLGQFRHAGRRPLIEEISEQGQPFGVGHALHGPAEVEASIPGILNLAWATGTDLALAADIAGRTLRAFAPNMQIKGSMVGTNAETWRMRLVLAQRKT